jgi:hypothetical protein
MRLRLLLVFILSGYVTTCFAWLYPEHRDITLRAIGKLDPSRRSILNELWQKARIGHEARLCLSVVVTDQGINPDCLDYAAWPAIGGDHSRSSADLANIVLKSKWIINVADIAAHLKEGLSQARSKSERLNRVRDSDVKLLRADPEYVSRAGANNGHFMFALPNLDIHAKDFFEVCFRKGTEMNTDGTYMWFHVSALLKARKLATGMLSPEEQSVLALSILADEAFALHFLEDSFTSGHIAGVWGDASLRKGTHDYYNEKGLKVDTWTGSSMVLMGDAFMRTEDAEWAANSVWISLNQLLDILQGTLLQELDPGAKVVSVPDTFDVSRAIVMPERHVDTLLKVLCYEVLVNTPIPGLATGIGELPRFRSELGPFVGIAPAARVNYMNGGFGASQNTPGIIPGLDLSIRFGLGMDGVLNESGDGLVFLDLGWRIDGTSSMRFDDEPALKSFGSYAAALPSRDAYYARLRLPFCLIPGDLLVAGPILLLASPKTLNKMIVAAGNGGLIPWQSGLITPIGRFQFVLGREVGVCLYGIGNGPDAFLFEIDDERDEQVLISLYSTQLDFPIFEYRPLRTFSSRQSASLVLQLSAGVDIPGKRTLIYPEADPLPDVKSIWFIGLRLVFDWRYYFTGNKL